MEETPSVIHPTRRVDSTFAGLPDSGNQGVFADGHGVTCGPSITRNIVRLCFLAQLSFSEFHRASGLAGGADP